MDKSCHALHTCFQDPVRLIATNQSVMNDLDKFVDEHVVVTVSGYFRTRHLEVYHVDIATNVLDALKKAKIF